MYRYVCHHAPAYVIISINTHFTFLLWINHHAQRQATQVLIVKIKEEEHINAWEWTRRLGIYSTLSYYKILMVFIVYILKLKYIWVVRIANRTHISVATFYRIFHRPTLDRLLFFIISIHIDCRLRSICPAFVVVLRAADHQKKQNLTDLVMVHPVQASYSVWAAVWRRYKPLSIPSPE